LNEAALSGRYRVPGASDIAAGAFQKLNPIPQFKAIANLGRIPESIAGLILAR
jgi:hypothetical protein